MGAVILAVFPDYETAERVRVALVRDGFPTDRVDLTAQHDLGRAGVGPADSAHAKCVQYFGTLLTNKDERHYSEALARRIGDGAAAVVVHPRGALETARAMAILKQANPVDMVGHDLTKHAWERAAADSEGYWIKHFWPESAPGTDCIYCRLFRRPLSATQVPQ
jgi:hypothetical protein